MSEPFCSFQLVVIKVEKQTPVVVVYRSWSADFGLSSGIDWTQDTMSGGENEVAGEW